METYTRRLARCRRGVQDSRNRARDLFLSSLPPVACFALHARLALAFLLSLANGITLKPDKKFHHDINVQHIARIEAKQLKVSGELENLETSSRA